MRAYRFFAGGFPLCLLLVVNLLTGCATKGPVRSDIIMFPPPPDEARIQYLWSFGSESELGGRGRFSDFIVGTESVYRPIIKPYGIEIRDGKIYVCDTQAGNVSISDLKTRRMRYLKPEGQAALKLPVNVEVDGDGTIFLTDSVRGQLLAYDQQGVLLYALGEKDEMKPSGLALTQDRIYLTDLKNACVRVYDKSTRQLLLTFPGESETDDRRKLFQPTNLAVDREGLVYVSDTGGFAVKIYDARGNYLRTIGELGVTPGQFALPKGIATDREGRLYVLDAAAPVIQLFDNEGRLLMYFGQPQTSGAGGLYLPADLLIDYENTDLFQQYVAPGYKLEYVILVTNQLGPKKVSVYGFVTKT